jgi:hypothetical protein
LIKLTSKKVTYFYDLMDAAYDAKRINETSRGLAHVTITDKNGRGKKISPWHRMKQNATRCGLKYTERANSRLKEEFGANNVMVKGLCKVTQHLMFGVVALFADQLLCRPS